MNHKRCKLCIISKRIPTIRELIQKLYKDNISTRQIRKTLQQYGVEISHMSVQRHLKHTFTKINTNITIPEGTVLSTKTANDLFDFLIEGMSVEDLDILSTPPVEDSYKEPIMYTEESMFEFWLKLFKQHTPSYVEEYKKRYQCYLKHRDVINLPYLERKKLVKNPR